MEGMGRCGGTGLEELSELWTLGPAELVLVGGLPDAGKLGLAASLAYWHADDRFPDDGTDLPPAAVGRLAALLRWPFRTPSRSLGLEPVSTQLLIEFWPSESPAHNQKLGHAVFSPNSHTGLKNFATGPITLPNYHHS